MDARRDEDRCAAEVRAAGSARVWGLILPFLGGASASYRSTNFVVEAPTRETARRVAEHAEVCRTTIARAWLGHEIPNWKTPCPVRVKLTMGEAGGLTSFGFHQGRVTDQSITVEGRLDRILASALPHEITHTIFAAYFGGPMPRWADEGASLLSEDLLERQRHDQISIDLFARRGELPLARLFLVENYPEGPDGLLRPGLLYLEVPHRDGRTTPLPGIRPRRDEAGLGRRHPDPLPTGRRPRARPRLCRGTASRSRPDTPTSPTTSWPSIEESTSNWTWPALRGPWRSRWARSRARRSISAASLAGNRGSRSPHGSDSDTSGPASIVKSRVRSIKTGDSASGGGIKVASQQVGLARSFPSARPANLRPVCPGPERRTRRSPRPTPRP